jgi:hypothetical protein
MLRYRTKIQNARMLMPAGIDLDADAQLWRLLRSRHGKKGSPAAQFKVPVWGDRANYGIGLSFRSVSYILHFFDIFSQILL